MTDNYVRKVQYKQLEILQEVDRICKQHELTYYLIGGSALGAVRHSGFIPWDDDIDIGLFRSDYELFLGKCRDDLNSHFFLQTKHTDKHYMYQFAKIRLNNTAYVQEELKYFDIHHGIYIDIFPMDGVPDVKVLRSVQKYACRFFSLVRSLKIQSSEKIAKNNIFKWLVKRLLSYTVPWKVVHLSINWIVTRVPESDSKYVGNLLGSAGYDREIMPVEFYKHSKILKFEGYSAPIPNQWDAYLSQLYGDYMSIPPKEKQRNHNPCYVDLDNAVTEKLFKK